MHRTEREYALIISEQRSVYNNNFKDYKFPYYLHISIKVSQILLIQTEFWCKKW